MDLPLRVLVSAVVVGLTVPAVLGAWSAYETDQASVRAVQAIDAIVRAAQQFYVAGGGAEDVRVDLGGGITARIEYVRIGDAPGGPLGPSASYRVTGQPEVLVLSDPAVPMSGLDGPLRLGSGRHVVRITFDGQGDVRVALA